MNERRSAVIINYPYQTQEVRDLAWACFSPPMLHLEQIQAPTDEIQPCGLTLTTSRQRWLEQLDTEPSALLAYLALRPTHRLGIYFEQLWHFFLQQDPKTDLVAHNLPIHDQGRTIGEFDCIYYCHERSRHIHLELAVKYFLSLPSASITGDKGTASDWVGPDNKDRLDLKLEQLIERQILLGDHPMSQVALRELGITSLSKEIGLKGYLFLSRTIAQTPAQTSPTPPGYNDACTLALWVPFDQLQAHCNGLDKAATYAMLPKMQWLSPVLLDNLTATMTQQEIESHCAQHFNHDYYPLMVVALDNLGNESSRFFVTPQTWPAICNQ